MTLHWNPPAYWWAVTIIATVAGFCIGCVMERLFGPRRGE